MSFSAAAIAAAASSGYQYSYFLEGFRDGVSIGAAACTGRRTCF